MALGVMLDLMDRGLYDDAYKVGARRVLAVEKAHQGMKWENASKYESILTSLQASEPPELQRSVAKARQLAKGLH